MTVCIITLGGTIAGRAHENLNRSAYAERNLVTEYLLLRYSNLKFESIEKLCEKLANLTLADIQLLKKHVRLKFDIVPLCNKDSTDLTAADIKAVAKIINSTNYERYVVVQGTDTAIVTGRCLKKLVRNKAKDVRLTFSFSPLTDPDSDGHVNLKQALTDRLRAGIWLVTEGHYFDPDHTHKKFRITDVRDNQNRFFRSALKYPDHYYRKTGPALGARSAGKNATYSL